MRFVYIKDNYFDNAEELRDLALSTRFYTPEEMTYNVGWKGYRTDELREFNNDMLEFSCQKIRNELMKLYQFEIDKEEGNFYFHTTLNNTKTTLEDFDLNKFHTDNSRYAGIIYLNPNPPPKTGTTIVIDDQDNHIENKFNRFVTYPSYYTHAPTDLFGDDMETSRLTLVFFI